MIIYFDLDGVLVDFDKIRDAILEKEGIKNFSSLNNKTSSLDIDKKAIKNKFWSITKNMDSFYYKLPILEKGINLFNIVKDSFPCEIKILTSDPSALPLEKSSEEKKRWVKDNLGNYEVIICSKKDKNEVVPAKGNILIDDREININKWEEAGGVGLLFE